MSTKEDWVLVVGISAGNILSPQYISKMADGDEDFLLRRFTTQFVDKMGEMEELAAEILTDRQQVNVAKSGVSRKKFTSLQSNIIYHISCWSQIVELDRKRNSNREALRALKNKSEGLMIILGGF